MRKLITSLVVVALLLVSVTSALAAGKPPTNPGKGHSVQAPGTPPGLAKGHSNQDGMKATKTAKGQVSPSTELDESGRALKQNGKSPVMGTEPGRSPRANSAFVAGATIGSVNPISGTMVITVYHGNHVATAANGEPITLTVNTDARIMQWTPTGVVSATLADLTAGQNIMVKGRFIDGVWTVERIMVDLGLGRMPALQPEVSTEPVEQ